MNYRGVSAMLIFIGGFLSTWPAISGSLGSQYANVSEGQISEFSATYRLIHIASGTVLESARVQIASHGMTVHQLLGSSHAAIVFNTDSDQLWLINVQRRVYLEVPITRTQGANDKGGVEALSIESRASDATDVSAFAPFLQFQPCLSMDGVVVAKTRLQGRQVDVWKCADDGAVVETQWFDVSLSMVLKGISEDGYLSKLIDVKEVSLSTEHFAPPAGFRAVSINEFIGKPELIKHYNEKRYAPKAKGG